MRSPRSMRQEILKKWIIGLKVIDPRKKKMNSTEWKTAIKLSADIAMASTRRCKTCWSCAIISKASKDEDYKVVVEHIPACHHQEPTRLNKISMMERIRRSNKRVRTKKILNKSRGKRVKSITSTSNSSNAAKLMAKMLVKSRIKVLKNLVPGGEIMDDISLLRETLDYLVSLQAQVDVMRTLVNVTQNSGEYTTTGQ